MTRMNHTIRLPLAAIVPLTIVLACTSGRQAERPGETVAGAAPSTAAAGVPQPNADTAASARTNAAAVRTRGALTAAAGDTVRVLVTPVRADRGDDFDRWFEEFHAAGRRLGASDDVLRRTAERTRVIRPLAPDSSGVLNYVFIEDPVIPGATYSIETLLRRMHPVERADSLYLAYQGMRTGQQSGWTVTQTSLGRVNAGTMFGAAPTDTVWLVINPVRADRRREFERLVEEFWADGVRLGANEPATLHSFRYTRVLYPTAPEPDGSYVYLFVMDPVFSGADYDIATAMKRMHPTAHADSILAAWDRTMAGEQRLVAGTQTRLGAAP